MKLIQEAFESACQAETELAKNRQFITNTLKETHGFITKVASNSSIVSDITNPALNSIVDHTIEKYRDPNLIICWGCGAENDHFYYGKRLKKIVCPMKDDPDVQKRAAKIRKDFVERAKIRRGNKKTAINSSLCSINHIVSSFFAIVGSSRSLLIGHRLQQEKRKRVTNVFPRQIQKKKGSEKKTKASKRCGSTEANKVQAKP